MQKVSPIIEELIRALRATRMPWIGDEIEGHIRLGKTNLFLRGDDDNDKVLLNLQVSRLGQKDKMTDIAESSRDGSETDEDGEDLSLEEQIEAAIQIIDTNISGRVKFNDESYKCLSESFKLENMTLAILDGDGKIIPLLSDKARKAADELPLVMKKLRDWLIDQKQLNNGK